MISQLEHAGPGAQTGACPCHHAADRGWCNVLQILEDVHHFQRVSGALLGCVAAC